MATTDATSLFNEAIRRGLKSIYPHLGEFHVLVEIIQKLAQQLNFDTFVDKDALTHLSLSAGQSFKRLTIAGSLVLIDIDFSDDSTVIKVSLSLANLRNETFEELSVIEENSDVVDGVISITLSERAISKVSILKNNAESILLHNLSTKDDGTLTLSKFPCNLQYLAAMDNHSTPSLDLFKYLDHVALIFTAIGEIEGGSYADFTAKPIGNLQLNSIDDLELGVFLTFWRDFKYLTDKLDGEKPTVYTMKCSIQQFNEVSAPKNLEFHDDQPELFLDSKWTLNDKMYVFKTPGVKESLDLVLHLEFNTPIVIPRVILQYLNISAGIHDEEIPEIFQELNQRQEAKIEFPDDKLPSTTVHLLYPQDYTYVKSVELRSLSKIQQVIPVLRNILCLNNLIRTLTQRGMFLKFSDTEAQLRNNLKESLKLDESIMNEELMNINLGGNDGLKKFEGPGINLDEFVQSESESATIKQPVPFVKISFGEAEPDLISSFGLRVEASFENHLLVDVSLKIVNGEIEIDKNDDIDMTEEAQEGSSRQTEFVRALNLTEDLANSLKYVYN